MSERIAFMHDRRNRFIEAAEEFADYGWRRTRRSDLDKIWDQNLDSIGFLHEGAAVMIGSIGCVSSMFDSQWFSKVFSGGYIDQLKSRCLSADPGEEPGTYRFIIQDGSIMLDIKQEPGLAEEPLNGITSVLKRIEPEIKAILVSSGQLSENHFKELKPEILDQFDGVIRGIGASDITVSLIDDEDEFLTKLPRKLLEDKGVPLREGEGFRCWVERETQQPDIERFVVMALETVQLTDEDEKEVEEGIRRLMDGDK